MKILSLHTIKGRGRIVCVALDGACPVTGDTLRRTTDDERWWIRGIERGAITPRAGMKVGLVLARGPDIAEGDDVAIVPPSDLHGCGHEQHAPHVCPFKEEIHGGGDECTCCEGCAYECAQDI